MSTRAVNAVVARAVSEVEFRERLAREPEDLLTTLGLSSTEIESLVHLLDKPVLEEFAGTLTRAFWSKVV